MVEIQIKKRTFYFYDLEWSTLIYFRFTYYMYFTNSIHGSYGIYETSVIINVYK